MAFCIYTKTILKKMREKYGSIFFRFRAVNTKEPTPIVIDDADVDSSDPEILTVQEDEDGDKDDDAQIDIHR